MKPLKKQELVTLMDNVIRPKGKGFSSEELNQQLLHFAMHCPDPVRAMDLVIDAPRGVAAIELVDKAMAIPRRDVATIPESQLAMTHPLRHMTLDET